MLRQGETSGEKSGVEFDDTWINRDILVSKNSVSWSWKDFESESYSFWKQLFFEQKNQKRCVVYHNLGALIKISQI